MKCQYDSIIGIAPEHLYDIEQVPNTKIIYTSI